MKKAFSNPKMEIKSFSRESILTLSGEVKTTNEEYVTNALDTATAGKSAKTSLYNLIWD